MDSKPEKLDYECDCCGACCKTFPIFASQKDAAQEPRIEAETQKLPAHLATNDWAYQMHPLPFHEACCFLGEENLCQIYKTRPVNCQTFAAGSEQCQEARARHGIEPLLKSP